MLRAPPLLHAHGNRCAEDDDKGDAAQRVAKAGLERVDHLGQGQAGAQQRQRQGDGEQCAKHIGLEFGRQVDDGHNAEDHQNG